MFTDSLTLSIRIGEDMSKLIFFGDKFNTKQAEVLNLVYGNIKIKYYPSHFARLYP